MGRQGLPDSVLWDCVCICEVRVGQRIRVGGRVVLLDIYYIYLAFNLAANICININVCRSMLSAALCLCIRVYAGVCARHMLKYLIAAHQVVAVNGSWQQAAVQ